MKNQDFTAKVAVNATPEEAFNAINNVRGWWSENIEGDTGKLNGEFTHQDRYLTVTMKITRLTQRKIVWEIVESHNYKFPENKYEWDNTRIVFEIMEKSGKTAISFTHEGLVPDLQCYEICSSSWEFFITSSLKNLIETGKGKPISHEDASFTTSFTVDQSPKEVFDAIRNVRGWWSENIEGDTDQINCVFSYHYQDVHRCKVKITELIPNKRVVWHVLDNYFKFTEDKREWTGTHVIFEVAEKGGKTQLKFIHQGLVPEYECFKICHDAWTHYIQESLKALIETGKGNPTPKDAAHKNMDTSLPAQQDSAGETSLKSICHRLLIEVPVEKVYEALTTQEGLAGWWTPETTAKPEIGSVSRFAFGPDYYKEMKVEELKPYSVVKWHCLTGYEEWIGTRLTFELEPHSKGTILFFHHDGWKEYTPELASCTYAWGLFFRSLKFLCETGKGFPYPDFNR